MREYQYDIIMKTPIGKRKGRILVQISGREIEGYLELFGRKEPMAGEIEEDGECSLTGNMVTLMQTIPYLASGYMDEKEIVLIFQTKQQKFQVQGELRNMEKK